MAFAFNGDFVEDMQRMKAQQIREPDPVIETPDKVLGVSVAADD